MSEKNPRGYFISLTVSNILLALFYIGSYITDYFYEYSIDVVSFISRLSSEERELVDSWSTRLIIPIPILLLFLYTLILYTRNGNGNNILILIISWILMVPYFILLLFAAFLVILNNTLALLPVVAASMITVYSLIATIRIHNIYRN